MTKLYYKYLFADNYEAVVTTSEELIPVDEQKFSGGTGKSQSVGTAKKLISYLKK